MPGKELRRKARVARVSELSGSSKQLEVCEEWEPSYKLLNFIVFYLKCRKDIIPFAHS